MKMGGNGFSLKTFFFWGGGGVSRSYDYFGEKIGVFLEKPFL
jgi:hypothetical protein